MQLRKPKGLENATVSSVRPGLAGKLIVGNFSGGDAEESSHAEPLA
jgi:hypothetical protein